MKGRKLLQAALGSILKNGMRSLLTMLGIIIGVCSVIVMVALGSGTHASIEGEITSLGTNLIFVSPATGQSNGVSQGAGSRNTLTIDDVEALKAEREWIEAVSPIVRVTAQVVHGTQNWPTSVYGVSPEYAAMRNMELVRGIMFTARDEQTRRKVAVLGHTVAQELFDNRDPIGTKIRVRNVPFTVIGVLGEEGDSGFGTNQDDLILVPSLTASYRLSGSIYVQQIIASAVDANAMDAAEEEVRAHLRMAHRLQPDEADDFDIRSQTDLLETASTITGTMTALLGAIAGVSLLVGGIGIMNIMLVSVTERTREIGIRLAIGARGNDVLLQFLIEALALSVLGGIIGLVSGIGLGQVITSMLGVPFVLESHYVGLAVGFAAAVGVFFGYYPARKAAALDPIEALRYE